MFRIPVFEQNPAYEYSIQLEGVSYRLTFTWNERTKAWYLDIADDNGTEIVSGKRIIHTWPLFGRYALDTLPPGSFFALVLDDSDLDPLFEDLGTRVSLTYLAASEETQTASSVDFIVNKDP